MYENQPKLFRVAQGYEKMLPDGVTKYTWNDDESLEELCRPERIMEIRSENERRMEIERKRLQKNRTLFEVFADSDVFGAAIEAWETDKPCEVCR